MKLFINRILSHRFGTAALLVSLVVIISLLTRVVLLIKSFPQVDFSILNILGIFILGFFYDAINAGYVIIPLIFYLWLIPDKLFRKNWHRFILYGIFFFFTFGLLFNAVSEFLFWDEFNTRFNFIAVDYLVYTTEVIGNIQQSYPIEVIIFTLLLFTGVIVFFLRTYIRMPIDYAIRLKKRTLWALCLFMIPVISFFTIHNKLHRFSTNAFVNELSGNGLYELFAAYLNNELDYEQFYSKIDNTRAFSRMRELVKTPESEFVDANPLSIERRIINQGSEKKLNVVMISVESFSADFMRMFGNTENITPFLDSLAQHSLVFTNLYATGTRTVRGLEALSLCVPPTPGQSIVRRPKNENLFSLGKVFNSKGYESKYIYGGYGYFDNMNGFFSANNYTVVDRSALQPEEIDYENIWGVADENLFTLALKEIDKTVETEKPIFAQVMTVSNHRPYTYPEGRIDIPSHTGREGAVKYTDYAINKFLEEARSRPWFDSTVFVIVADHCASSAGKTELPVNKYHIPMMIYSPANVSPSKMERLMSQIDMGPTLLGLLNFSYTSKFYGYDIFKLEPGRERIFISTYQNLGFIRNGKMVQLDPQQKVNTYTPNFSDGSLIKIENDQTLIDEAIAWYQTASFAFTNGLMK
ncbi:MAG: sulfatase-like hydrolase/transferase [Bacteroidia bacterium]|nr:sulfatase-like hydrolase/transferase [Bacteroidia bacterium]